MPIRPFRPQDAAALVRLAASSARGEADFVLNPIWESEEELFAEFQRHGVDPESHLLVADLGDGEPVGLCGFLRAPEATAAGLHCPIVARDQRGKGLGGKLLRAALRHAADELGIKLLTAGIGTRNRAGYALLTARGFRPVRQYFLMRCDEKPRSLRTPVEKLEIGLAREDDADQILEIYNACGFEERSAERMRELLGDAKHVHAVARFAGRVVAFAELDIHWPERFWVSFVGVDPDVRDRGVGSAVLAWAVAHRFDAGARGALLLLSPANRTGLRAYEKVGFRRYRLVDVLERGL